MEPVSQRDGRGKCGGESDDLEVRIEGAELEEKQLDEMAALGFQRVGFVDDHEADARLLQREKRGTRVLDRRGDSDLECCWLFQRY